MRTLGQLLICALLAVPSAEAAFGPWDLDVDSATALAHRLEHHVAAQADNLAIYLEVPVAQLRVLAELPLMRELTRRVGLVSLLQAPQPIKAHRDCLSRS